MPPRERERDRSRRRRGPQGGDPNRPSQLSRRERGLPTEDRGREPHRDRGVEHRRADRGRGRTRGTSRDSREWRSGRGRGDRASHREVYQARSPRQPRFPPPHVTETWETRRAPPRPPSETEEESDYIERGREERSRSRARGEWRQLWVWVPESPERDEDSRDDIPEEEVELEGESVDTVTGEPRVHLEEAVEAAPEVPGCSPEVASAVDFSATEDSIARQATEAATERSVSAEPDTLRERARELRSKAARPSASKPSPSLSEEQVEEKPPVEERVKPPPKATSAKAKTKRELVEAGDVVREVGVEQTSRAREGEGSSASGVRRSLGDIPTPPPAPTKEEIEQAEAARQLELQNLPPPPPAPRVPPVPATARATSKPKLTERIQPVVLAPRPKERPQQPELATPSTSARPAEPRGDPPVWQDKPLVLLDFHKTLSFPNNDPPIAEASVQTLKGLKEKGFAVGVFELCFKQSHTGECGNGRDRFGASAWLVA